VPDLADEMALIKIYGAPTVAITLNTAKMAVEDARAFAAREEQRLGIPVVLPIEDGLNRLVPIFVRMIEEYRKSSN